MVKPTDQNPLAQYSYAIQAKDTLDVSLGGIADLTWNSFYRAIYEKSAAWIQRQANMLLARGNVTREKARLLAAIAGGVVGFFVGGLFGWNSGQAAGGFIWQLAPISLETY